MHIHLADVAVYAAAPPPQAAPGVSQVGGGLIVVLILGFILFWLCSKKKAKPAHLVMAFVMGALLSGSMLGIMARQTSGAVGTGVGAMLGTVVGNPGSGTGR